MDVQQHPAQPYDFTRFFDLSFDMLCIANFEGYFLKLNAAWSVTLGYSEAELLATPYLDFVHPADRATTIAEASTIAHQGSSTIQFQNRYRHKKGGYRWLSWTSRPVVSENLIYAIARDVTQQKEAELALHHSERKYRNLYNSTPALLYTTDQEFRIVQVSDFWLECTGYSREEVIGQKSALFLTPESRQKAQTRDQPSYRQRGWISNASYQFVKKNGDRLDVLLSAVREQDATGQFIQNLVALVDITELKQSEEARQRAEQSYRSIFENALQGIFQATPEGHYLRVNQAMAELYGFVSPMDMMASRRYFHIPPAAAEPSDAHDQDFQYPLLQNDALRDFQYQIRRPDGQMIWLEENTRAVRERSGTLLYYEGIVEDITVRKASEVALQRQVERLQIEIDEQKRQRDAAKIVGTDYFQQLINEVRELRRE